jgi:hypothetical protein
MSTPEAFQNRPVPDLADLRLLGEIINNGAIGLPQAAWNAGMSQSEAAARLVTLAERGMPLRLVAEGDRQLLWQIAQAGPAVPMPPTFAPPPTPGPVATMAPSVAPPPLPGPDPSDRPEATVPPVATAAASGEPTRRVLTAGQPMQAVVGLVGEELDVSLLQILDPADSILTAVGERIGEGERALLIETSIGNRGTAGYEATADQYLQVVDTGGRVFGKAALTVTGYPAHQGGVPAHTLVSGWTVFLVPAGTEVAQVRWSIRPDLTDRAAGWSFGPAPADPAS